MKRNLEGLSRRCCLRLGVVFTAVIGATLSAWPGVSSLSQAHAHGLADVINEERIVPANGRFITVYSYRQPTFLEKLIEKFEQTSGVQVRVLYAPRGLEERVVAEGQFSPADLLLSTDVSRLENAVSLGIARPIDLNDIDAPIDDYLTDPDGLWLPLTTRVRLILVSRERVLDEQLSYADVASSRFEGRYCSRSGQHYYNNGLFSFFYAHNGQDATKDWLDGLRKNLAFKPKGNDRAQAKAIFRGQCDIAFSNSYYLGLMAENETDPEQKKWFDAVRPIMPSDGIEHGSHVNISGVVALKHSPNSDDAKSFVEFLLSPDGQSIYAGAVHEYPVRSDVLASPLVRSFGDPRPDKLPLKLQSAHRSDVAKLVDIVGYDSGP